MKKKVRVRYDRILLALVIVVLIICVFVFFFQKEEEKKIENLPNFFALSKEEIVQYGKDNNIPIMFESKYDEKSEKDTALEQKPSAGTNLLEVSEITITLSLGKFDKDAWQELGVNELGRVPVMMYHGIYDVPSNETPYTGGNYDKEGYHRTVEAFKEDLEFYYGEGYRMIKLQDYVKGKIDVELGKSPIVLTFDDGLSNNIKVIGLDEDGNIVIDPNSAVGVLESFKQKYPDYHVTATFFVNGGLFRQPQYNQKILEWLIKNGYDVANHTVSHLSLNKLSAEEVAKEVGQMYQLLEQIIPNRYVPIVSLPFGEPVSKSHVNFETILKGSYQNISYETITTMRVGWDSELSPFHKNFDASFIKRIRAYDNNGKEFDITSVFQSLKTMKYISDGNPNTIVVPEKNKGNIKEQNILEILSY